MVVHLPQQIRQRQRDNDGDSNPKPAARQNPALRCEQQRQQDGDQEENFVGLVFETETGAHTQHDPPVADHPLRIGQRVCLRNARQRQRTGQPEDRLEGIHRQKAVRAEINAGDNHAQHRESRRSTIAAHRPHQRPGHEHFECAGDAGNQPQRPHVVVAKQNLSEARLQGDHRRLVHITEGEMASAHEVIHLVAEDAVAGPLRENVANDLDRQLDGGHGETDPDKTAKALPLPGWSGCVCSNCAHSGS